MVEVKKSSKHMNSISYNTIKKNKTLESFVVRDEEPQEEEAK